MKLPVRHFSGIQLRRRTFFSLFFFIAFLAGCLAAWKYLYLQPKEDGALKPLRKAMYANESLFTSFFGNSRLSKTFGKSDVVSPVRINGLTGLRSQIDTGEWRLELIRNPGDTIFLTLDDIRALPKTEIIFDFKCIEGWSQITHWGGVRFSEFVKKYKLEDQVARRFTGMHTPDREYYVGIDNKSMMHPQTILCYEMNGKPLALKQGYPLRLIIPVKYGVKHLKRIGTIFFSENRPPDYWFERGYDYYCGL